MNFSKVICPKCGAGFDVKNDCTSCQCTVCGELIEITHNNEVLKTKVNIGNKRSFTDYLLDWRIITIGVLILVMIIISIVNAVEKKALEKKVVEASNSKGVTIAIPDKGNDGDDDNLIEKLGERVESFDYVTVQEQLKDMGFLVTAEYDCTAVEHFEEHNEFWGMKVLGTTSEFIYSYDSVVCAGIDFSEVTVDYNSDKKLITITVPHATLQDPIIDTDSFEAYYENEGVFTDKSIEDFGDSLDEYSKNVTKRAKDYGLVEKANENAKNLIYSFVSGFVDETEYEIKVVIK